MAGANRKIMVVDDNILDVMEVEEELAETSYEVVRLVSPNGALAKIDFEQPDVLLVDITMDRLDADELMETLRSSAQYEDLIVVAFADRGADELEDYCVEHDMNAYYTKSMDVGELTGFLDNFF